MVSALQRLLRVLQSCGGHAARGRGVIFSESHLPSPLLWCVQRVGLTVEVMIESYRGCMEGESMQIDNVLFGWEAMTDEWVQVHRSHLRSRIQEVRRCIQCELVGRDVLLSRFDRGLKSFQYDCLFTNSPKDISPLCLKCINQGTALTHSLAAGIPATLATRRLGTLSRGSLCRPQPV